MIFYIYNISIATMSYSVFSPPPFLAIFRLNGVLLARKANTKNSSNNTVIRPGAANLVRSLLETGKFLLVFYSAMNKQNMQKTLKILFNPNDEKKERLFKTTVNASNNSNIIMLHSQHTNIALSKEQYHQIQNKKLFIDLLNQIKCNGERFYNEENTILIDYKRNDTNTLLVSEFNGNITKANTDCSAAQKLHSLYKNDESNINDTLFYDLHHIFIEFLQFYKNIKPVKKNNLYNQNLTTEPAIYSIQKLILNNRLVYNS